MLYYVLNKNIDGNKVIQDITKIVQKIPHNELEHTVLTISLQKITNCTGDSHLPKIEYKQPEP